MPISLEVSLTQIQNISSNDIAEQGSFGSYNDKSVHETSFLDMINKMSTEGTIHNEPDTVRNEQTLNQKIRDDQIRYEKTNNNESTRKDIDSESDSNECSNENNKLKISKKNEEKESEDDDKFSKEQSNEILNTASNANIQLQKDQKLSSKKAGNEVKSVSEAQSSENQLSEDLLTYLQTPEEINSLESMIDNAKEFSIENSDKEKLLKAQNLSVEDPELFLSKVDNIKNEVKMDIIQDDKKLNNKKLNTNKKEKINNPFTIIDERGSLSKEDSLKNKNKFNTTIIVDKQNSSEVTMLLEKNVQQNILSTSNQAAGASSSNFQAMLSEQIQNNAPEFVKAGNIVLQDNKSGSINMILKPESLGSVKINLQLSDKVITGQITVTSQEAYDAFKENIETLKESFQQNGFESASFNLSFAGNGNSGSQGQQQEMNNSWFAERAYSDYAYSTDDSESSQSDIEIKKNLNYTIDYVA